MSLRIPGKTLEDNFKLADFQGDFSDLQRLLLRAIAQPKKIVMIGSNRMEFQYNDGTTKVYQFEKSGAQIRKIICLSDGTETNVELIGGN